MFDKFLLVFFATILVAQNPACADTQVSDNRATSTNSMRNREVILPKPIDSFVQAVNKGDTERFLSFFDQSEGIVNDWGRKFVGHKAIRGWSEKEFIGAKGRMTPTKVEQKDNVISLWAGWKSNFYTGDSKFIFTIDGEEIVEMRIVENK